MKSVVTVALALSATSGHAQKIDEATTPGRHPVTAPAPDDSNRIIPRDTSAPPFAFADVPVVVSGPIAEGEAFLSGPMRYSYPATLRGPFSVNSSLGRFEFAAGDEFYGVPIDSSPTLHGIIYCSPRFANGRASADCLSMIEKKQVSGTSVSASPFLTTGVMAAFSGTTSKGDLRLEPGPNRLSDGMTVRVRVVTWSNRKIRLVTEAFRGADIVSSVRSDVKVDKGTALVGFGTGLAKLTPSGATGTILWMLPVKAGDDVIPRSIRRR